MYVCRNSVSKTDISLVSLDSSFFVQFSVEHIFILNFVFYNIDKTCYSRTRNIYKGLHLNFIKFIFF